MGQKSEHQQEEGCCPRSENIPCGPALLSGTPGGSLAIPPTQQGSEQSINQVDAFACIEQS